MIRLGMMLAAVLLMSTVGNPVRAEMTVQTFPVSAGAGAHDVYPAPDGTVWFTAQSAGKLGRLDPRTGKSDFVALGPGAAPHGVIVGPDGAAWVTEGGQNAIARVDPATRAAKLFPLPKGGATPTSTRQPLIIRVCFGSLGRTASTAASIPNQARWRCSTRRTAPGPTASPRHRTVRCSSPHLPATMSARSISIPPMSRSWSHLCRIKARAAFGATAAAGSGSPAGTAAISSAKTVRPRVGRAGTSSATGGSPMPSMSTRPMRCGSATGAKTRSCASTPRPRNSKPFRYPIATPECGSSQAGRAKSGAPNHARISSSS